MHGTVLSTCIAINPERAYHTREARGQGRFEHAGFESPGGNPRVHVTTAEETACAPRIHKSLRRECGQAHNGAEQQSGPSLAKRLAVAKEQHDSEQNHEGRRDPPREIGEGCLLYTSD